MVDNRFNEIACEMVGVKSLSVIKREELVNLLIEHYNDYKEEYEKSSFKIPTKQNLDFNEG